MCSQAVLSLYLFQFLVEKARHLQVSLPPLMSCTKISLPYDDCVFKCMFVCVYIYIYVEGDG